MESNIPFGYNDDGTPILGINRGISHTLKLIEEEKEKARLERDYKEGMPSSPDEANEWFYTQRNKVSKENE